MITKNTASGNKNNTTPSTDDQLDGKGQEETKNDTQPRIQEAQL